MTKLLYLHNSNQFQIQAHVLEVRTLEDGRTTVILDQTIFYPQGGGQPCDTGTITAQDAAFTVTDVRLDKDGIVNHIGTFKGAAFTPGQAVTLSIDPARRQLNTKLHAAGHILDCAIKQLNFAVKIAKSYHFPDNPNVEYEGVIDNSQETVQALQDAADKLIQEDLPISMHEISFDQALQQGIRTPACNVVRVVEYAGFPLVGCGGTHVQSAKEIGKIVIRKIKTKGGFTKISYLVAEEA